MAIDEFLVDVRVVERHIAAGRLTREEYEKYLQNLKDCSKDAEGVEGSLADKGIVVEPKPSKKKKKRGGSDG